MNIEHILPGEIEKRSFEIISEELAERGICLPEDRDLIIRRAIHTTADFEYAETLVFSDDAVMKAHELLAGGCDIVTDTNMALAGISKAAAGRLGCKCMCLMAEPDIAEEAKRRGITRASVSMEHAARTAAQGGRKTLFAVGNAPTALITLREMIDNGGYRPDFIIGVPVGFVNVEAAKELIIETDVPHIVNRGRKGGSNVAAAIVNALMYTL